MIVKPRILVPTESEARMDSATISDFESGATSEMRVAEIIAALSYGLDMVEGHPEGHAVRTCLIGMAIADALRLGDDERSSLFYALLLKDLGGSANAAKLCCLFGADDRKIKHNLKLVDWSRMTQSMQFMSRNVMPDGSPLKRALRAVVLALEGTSGLNRLIQARSERGAELARRMGFTETTAMAIAQLDEHWDGRGHPAELEGERISLPARIACLAQNTEMFFSAGGPAAAVDVARQRRGTWFDPDLVDAFLGLACDNALWESLARPDLAAAALRLEPQEFVRAGNAAAVDRIARVFAQVIDAKSHWTYRHSENVARIGVGIANVLGLPEETVSRVYRAGLLHDVGKLAVSNLILDKPGNLTADEYVELRRHPRHTYEILSRTSAFGDITEMAASHHERFDGRGYHRGIRSSELPIEARLLMVADVCDALSSKRPYRNEMPREKVQAILSQDAGSAVCPECVEALKVYQDRTDIITRVNDQLNELERVMATL